MPSKTKKQLNFFKLVKSYVDGGAKELVLAWRNMYNSDFPSIKVMDKIKDVAQRIDYADLEDMASGVEGDEVLGDKKDVRVGYWMKFDSYYRDYHNKVFKNTFIAKITKMRPNEKMAIFNSNDLHNKNGIRIEPLRRVSGATTVENIWLDYVHFNQITETAKTKNELITKNEIRKIIRELISEEFESSNFK